MVKEYKCLMDSNKLKQILQLLKDVNTSEFSEPISNGETTDDIIRELEHLKKRQKEEEESLELITDYFASISNGEYEAAPPKLKGNSSIDVLGFAMNAFIEELKDSAISFQAFDQIFDSLKAAFFIVDISNEYLTRFNLTALHFFNYKKDNRFQIPLDEFVDKAFLKEYDEFLNSNQHHHSKRIEFGGRHGVVNFNIVDGEYFNGKSISIFIIDVTAEVEKEQLEKSNQIIRKSLEFRTQFLANMSHEIRTPLNGIVGMVDYLIGMEVINGEVEEYLRIIQSSSNQLLSVVNDVLNLSRLESGKFELNPISAYLPQVIERGITWFEARLNEKNINLKLDVNISYWKALYFDESRLLQVLSNLVGNAIKFAPQDSDLHVRVNQIEENEDKIKFKFEVIDNGQGISKENQEKLFSIFGKIEQSVNKEGTGLGLIISKQLVELFKGEIGVVSELGKGANFWFTAELDKRMPSQSTSTIVMEEEMLVEVTNKKIKALLVDDRAVNRKVGGLILKKLDFDVDEAVNGEEAFHKTLSGDYDVVYMDIQMPIMNGVEATTQIRKTLLKNSPIIVGLSANAMEGDSDYYIKQGMDFYIMKPITSEKIIKVRSAIEAKLFD